jgi:hypothetical protein
VQSRKCEGRNARVPVTKSLPKISSPRSCNLPRSGWSGPAVTCDVRRAAGDIQTTFAVHLLDPTEEYFVGTLRSSPRTQAQSSAALRTSFSRTWPVSIIRCPRAASSNRSTRSGRDQMLTRTVSFRSSGRRLGPVKLCERCRFAHLLRPGARKIGEWGQRFAPQPGTDGCNRENVSTSGNRLIPGVRPQFCRWRAPQRSQHEPNREITQPA